MTMHGLTAITPMTPLVHQRPRPEDELAEFTRRRRTR